MEGSDGNLSAADYSSGTDNSIVSSPEPPVESVHLESRLAVERDLLENDTTLLSAEREKLLQDLAAKEEKLKREKAEQEAMLSKIKALESKLISGTGKFLCYVRSFFLTFLSFSVSLILSFFCQYLSDSPPHLSLSLSFSLSRADSVPYTFAFHLPST